MEVSEPEVPLFLGKSVRIDAKRKRRVGVPELPRYPSKALARLKRHRRPGVSRGVKPERADTVSRHLATYTAPAVRNPAGVEVRANPRAEDPLRDLTRALGECLLGALSPKTAQFFQPVQGAG